PPLDGPDPEPILRSSATEVAAAPRPGRTKVAKPSSATMEWVVAPSPPARREAVKAPATPPQQPLVRASPLPCGAVPAPQQTVNPRAGALAWARAEPPPLPGGTALRPFNPDAGGSSAIPVDRPQSSAAPMVLPDAESHWKTTPPPVLVDSLSSPRPE